MLRAILATLGIALIAFGLFGGKSLERVYAGLNGVVDKFGAGGSSQELIADSTSVDSSGSQVETVNPVVSGALDDQIDEPDIQTAERATTVDSSAVDSSTAVQSEVAEPASAAASNVATGDDEKLDLASVEPDSQGKAPDVNATVSGGAEGSADSSSDNSGEMQEVRASARNKELELALSTTENESAEVQKEAAVGEIVQTTAGGSSVESSVEALFVLKDLVNMRQGPSIEHPVVLRLEKGQELMEFKRDGKWVHVGAYGTSGKIGWVHERLVGKTPG